MLKLFQCSVSSPFIWKCIICSAELRSHAHRPAPFSSLACPFSCAAVEEVLEEISSGKKPTGLSGVAGLLQVCAQKLSSGHVCDDLGACMWWLRGTSVEVVAWIWKGCRACIRGLPLMYVMAVMVFGSTFEVSEHV